MLCNCPVYESRISLSLRFGKSQNFSGKIDSSVNLLQVKAAVMNHGSFTNREEVDAVTQPLLINASDKDQLLSRERLAQYQGALDCKKSVPSDVKVLS